MTTLHIRLSSIEETRARFIEAGNRAVSGEKNAANPSLNFLNYDDMHKVLAPSRLAIIQILAGNGALSIREVARRSARDVQAVHRDVTMLINAGVIDRTDKGISFPYNRIHFDFDMNVAA